MVQADHSAIAAVLRALAGAANALRLYPPTSDLPAEAVARFVELANEAASSLGHLRFVIEPKHFTWGETAIGQENVQIETLAQALYSQQAGQLLVAPGVTDTETIAFLQAVERDKAELKDAGGITKALVSAGVSHMAVVEMSVRVSDEEGLTGVDLLAAPLEEIGQEVAAAAARWAENVAAGTAVDEAEQAVGDLPEATREIAASRITDALLRLDESNRIRILEDARKRDPNGKPMEGMLEIIGKMSPAALSRLLILASQRTGEDPKSMLPELELPPGTMDLLAQMLSPSPQSEAQRGVPPVADHQGIAAEIAVPDEASSVDLDRQVASSAPSLAAGRGLATACFVTISHPEETSVQALGDALAPALRAGALGQIGDALELLDDLSERPELTDSVRAAHQALADPEILADACATVDSTVDPEIVARIMDAAGEVGYDVFVTCWTSGTPEKRAHLNQVLPRLGDRLVIAVSKLARGTDTPRAREAIGLIGAIGGSRSVPTLAQLLQHAERPIRLAALSALADIGGAESAGALTSGVGHGDAETRIAAAREIARGEVREAVPGLIRALEQYHLVERDAAFKTEVIRSMVALKAQEALPVLKRVVSRGLAFGAGNKVVRSTARKAIAELAS